MMTTLSVNKKYYTPYSVLLSISLWLFLLEDIYAKGGEPTAEIHVSAQVSPSCSMVVDDLKFGSYNLAKLHAAGGISVVCTKGTTYTIGVETTNKLLSKNNERDILTYFLYGDSERTKLWDSEENSFILSATGTGFMQSYNIYGTITENQDVPLGDYFEYPNIVLDIYGSNSTTLSSYQLSTKLKVSAVVLNRER